MVYIEDGEQVPKCPRCATLLKFLLKVNAGSSLLKWDEEKQMYVQVEDNQERSLIKCGGCGYTIKLNTLKFINNHME